MTSLQTSPTSVTAGFPDIALAGKAGAGKSTAADLLVELGYEKRSFAAPLKDIAAKLWGPDAGADRDKLQRLGVAVREIEEDTWANLLIQTGAWDRMLLRQQTGVFAPAPIVVDDLRFPNEYWALKAEGFVIVRLGADLNRRVDRLKANGKWQDERQLGHISETALDSVAYDYEIANDGNKDDLYDELVNILLKERRRR